jgi:cytochrome c biogenesis protein CcmG/thiol:disulfide interchange protein DsbE
MLRFLVPAAVFVVLLGFLYAGLSLHPSVIESPFIGKSAPPLSVPLLHDAAGVLSSAAFAGKPWVLNVWGTWCVACREEHQVLLQIARTKAVPIYGLDWKDDRDSALAWLQQLGNPYDAVGFDSEGRVAIDWGVYGAPETFLVDAHGIVVYKHIGPLDLEIWRSKFLPLIGAAKEPRT